MAESAIADPLNRTHESEVVQQTSSYRNIDRMQHQRQMQPTSYERLRNSY